MDTLKAASRAVVGLILISMGVSGAAPAAFPSFTRLIIDPNPGTSPVEKEMADLNGDGKLDIIVGCIGGGLFWWSYPASGKATDPWPKHTIKSSGSFYEDIHAIDLNGDGRPDILCSVDSSVRWYQHPGGDGTGAWVEHYISAGIGHEIMIADFDGDGKKDYATSRSHLVVFQNNPTSWTQVSYGGKYDGLSLLDIGSGRGAINLVAANDSGIVWFENPREHGGNARTDPWIQHFIGPKYGAGDQGPSLAAADLNRDGRMDVISAPNEGTPDANKGLIWWEAPADRRNGSWIPHTIDPSYLAVHKIVPADIDKNGALDLVLAEQEQSPQDRVAIFYNNGAGGFSQVVLETTGGQNNVVADVDGDGDLDILSINHGVYGAPHPIELFINNLNGGAPPPPPPPGQTPWGGSAAAIPGKILAVNFDNGGEGVAYHDLEAANQGGQYRTGEGVDIGTSSLSGGNGFAVGWCQAGEWIEYTVNVTVTGTYTLAVPVALPFVGGSFHVEFEGVDKTGAIAVPNTGGADTWQTVTKTGISLSAGTQVMRIVMDSNGSAGWVTNLNTLTFSSSGGGGGGGGVVGNGSGLTGDYFDNADFTVQKLSRTDATVNFDWGTGGPDPSVAADGFSVRWTGQVQAQFSETYTFYTVSDDGVRLWVNGALVINNWTDHAPTENSGTIPLTAGQKYDLKMEFYENGGGATAKLLWSGPSTAKQTLPQTQLYPAAGGGSPPPPPPPPPPSGTLARNPGFETDPNTDYFPYGSATFSWATDAAHSGSHSLKVVSVQPAGTLTRWLSKTTSITAQAGATYKANAWFKTSGVSDHAVITINFWDANGAVLGGNDGGTLSGTSNWTQLNVQGTAPAGTAFVRVEFRLWGPGSMWADDVTLTKN
ncbi:MAG: VCBS repeat-containing protein [Planctomycetes bacterium]|nr:VCBS repeat-containing protein [Planctomycetota bacterium]